MKFNFNYLWVIVYIVGAFILNYRNQILASYLLIFIAGIVFEDCKYEKKEKP